MTSFPFPAYSRVVEGRNHMALAIEKMLVPATGHRTRRADIGEQRLSISVVFTSEGATLAAFKEAGRLANNLGAEIKLIVAQVVPYPLPLETPPVFLNFSENRFRDLAAESQVDARVQIYLCRDQLETLLSVLPEDTLVVLGGTKPRWARKWKVVARWLSAWWLTKEERLARRLRLTGYQVLFTDWDKDCGKYERE